MPVPNRPIYIKKLAGAVAYYSTPPGPKVTITQSATGSCNFAGASSGCTAVSTMSLLNPDAAVLTDIVWAVSPPGVLSGANGLTSIQINVTSDENVTAAVTCTLKIDGVDTVLTGEVDSTHNDISEPLSITAINRDSGGSCEYPAGDTCVSSSVFSVTTSGGSGTKSYEWSVTTPAVISGSNTGSTVTVTTDGDTDATYTVTCEITDRKFVAFKNEEFTDTRVADIPITITDITRTSGGSCEFPSGGVCASTSEYTVAYTNATGPVRYQWNIIGNAAITSADNIQTITVLTNQTDTNVTYSVECQVVDDNSTDSLTKSFTDSKTPEQAKWFVGGANGFASRSTNDGTLFSAMTRGLNSGNTFSTITSIASNGSAVVAVQQQGWASRSTDNGVTWTALPRNLNISVTINFTSIAVNGNTWVATTSTGQASRSTDNGVTWTELPVGLGTGRANETRILNNGTVWVATVSGGLTFGRSTDDGATWTTVSQPTNATWRGAANSGSTFMATNPSGGVVISTDDGLTWSAKTVGAAGSQNPTVCGFGNTFVAAFGSGGAFRTTDSGANWTTINNTLLSGSTLGGGGLGTATRWMITGTNNGQTFTSTDDGLTWSNHPNSGLNSGNANFIGFSFASSF